MKRVVLLFAVFMVLSSGAQAQDPPGPEQGLPPTSLSETDGHWTANNAPDDTEGFEIYVVQSGDSLWALAEQLMSNPFLWPQLWEANEHIINPHWIYPDDRLLIRRITQITEAEPPAPPPDPEAAPEPEPDQAPRFVQLPSLTDPVPDAVSSPAPFDLPELRRAPVVKAGDLYCSGFVTTRQISLDSKVMAKFPGTEGAIATETEYVYLSRGSASGVSPGDRFTAVRPTRRVESTRDDVGDLGRHYLEVGQLEVVMAQPEFAMARIVHACGGIEVGDAIVEFQEIDFPELPGNRPFGPMMPSSGKITGAIAAGRDVLANSGSPVFGSTTVVPGVVSSHLAGISMGVVGESQIVYIDLGQRDGVEPGDIFLIYRPLDLDSRLFDVGEEVSSMLAAQRNVVGELIVLKVEERAATALVTFSSHGVAAGDLIELR